MVFWILVGVAVLGLLILALAVRPVLTRLVRLRRAMEGLLRRQAEVDALRVAVEGLQERMADVQARAELAQKSVAVIQARRAQD
ncbi:MAG TPA: hypothetical protein VFT95_09210 [Micromonosporaceae bacterium]|nr:hypothetical protein [Micromonosporaceae bacterium]